MQFLPKHEHPAGILLSFCSSNLAAALDELMERQILPINRQATPCHTHTPVWQFCYVKWPLQINMVSKQLKKRRNPKHSQICFFLNRFADALWLSYICFPPPDTIMKESV